MVLQDTSTNMGRNMLPDARMVLCGFKGKMEMTKFHCVQLGRLRTERPESQSPNVAKTMV